MQRAESERADNAGPDDLVRCMVRAADEVSAFETIYRRYVGNVTAYAVSRCASAADAADVVAQTFVRLLQVVDRYDPERGEPIAFIMAVAANVVRDHHRLALRQQRLVHRLAGRDLLTQDDTDRLEAAIDASRRAARAQDAVDGLPLNESNVFALVVQGASPAEAAAELGIPSSTARVRLFRARRRMRAQLGGSHAAVPASSTKVKEA